MILQCLTRYYALLAEDGRLPRPGYSVAKVSFALNLSESGELLDILPLTHAETRGKKTFEAPQTKVVPESATRSVGILPNFLCDNSSYLLGLDKKGKPDRSLSCFAASRELHQHVLNGTHCPAAEAVCGFFRKWNPLDAAHNAAFQAHREQILAGGNLVFLINGENFAHDDPDICRAWDAWRASRDPGVRMPCLVTGKDEPVAVLHPKIKGVAGAQSSGASLVSFNAGAYESFGREKGQGMNAPVGKYAAFAYTTALNHLLADARHRIGIGDTTAVFWAESPRPVYQNILTAVLNPQNEDETRLLADVMARIAQGKPVADGIDLQTPFYVLGLAPNAARLSVRFFLHNSFGYFLKNIRRHYDDLEIAHAPQDFPYLTLYWLLRETVNPNSSHKASSPLMSGEVLRAILLGLPYPQTLQSAVMLRIRAEQDDPDRHIQKITRGRAAILKACLLRAPHDQIDREVLSVSVNEESKNRAYVLGRLFAALEKTQKDASPGINSTIKDRYFTSACATPGSVFPALFKLYENHIGKIGRMENGKAIGIYDDKLVGRLMNKLDVDGDPFPAHLLLNDQSIFVLGYYHQVQSFFTPKAKKPETEEE